MNNNNNNANANSNINMNVNNGRMGKMMNLFVSDESKLFETLQNIDLHNYCESRVNRNSSVSIQSCSEEIIEETVVRSFSLMHEFTNNEGRFETCIKHRLKKNDQNESLIGKIIMSTFEDGFI